MSCSPRLLDNAAVVDNRSDRQDGGIVTREGPRWTSIIAFAGVQEDVEEACPDLAVVSNALTCLIWTLG